MGISESSSVQYCQCDANTREGLMTVCILDLQSDMAIHLLSQRLTEVGLELGEAGVSKNRIRLQYADGEFELLERTLLNFIMSDWLYASIDKRLLTLHPYLTDDEREYVALLAFHTLRKEEGPIAGFSTEEWEQRLQEAIHILIEQESPIIIDGLVRFRLRDYLIAVDSVLHELVEQFLTDREYEEFVSMLRYMLDAQPSSSQILHVYCTDDLVWISDEQGNLIRDNDVTNAAYQVTDDDEVNAEDLAMSILITRSPCNIIIHDTAKAAAWPSFPETVERVFLQRASRCGGCATCSKLEEASTNTAIQNPNDIDSHWVVPGHNE